MAIIRFGGHEILARLVSGNTANIFLARQQGAFGFIKLVCVKTLLPHLAQDAEACDRFVDEARVMSRLQHDNCVRVLDFGIERGVPYIVMEHVFGETLSTIFDQAPRPKWPISPRVASTIVAGLSRALHHAHTLQDENGKSYGLIHRDVTPHNLVLTYEGQPKLLDFSLVKADIGRETQTGIIKGTVEYMSPEQLTGGRLDQRTDIFALGVIFCELLTGRRLFPGLTPETMLERLFGAPIINAEVAADLSKLPRNIQETCRRALAMDPKDRFPTAAELAGALESSRAGEGELAELARRTAPTKYQERARVLERVLAGELPEQEVYRAFGGRPVLEMDLPSPAPSFPGVSPLVADNLTELAPAPKLPKGEATVVDGAVPEFDESDGSSTVVEGIEPNILDSAIATAPALPKSPSLRSGPVDSRTHRTASNADTLRPPPPQRRTPEPHRTISVAPRPELPRPLPPRPLDTAKGWDAPVRPKGSESEEAYAPTRIASGAITEPSKSSFDDMSNTYIPSANDLLPPLLKDATPTNQAILREPAAPKLRLDDVPASTSMDVRLKIGIAIGVAFGLLVGMGLTAFLLR